LLVFRQPPLRVADVNGSAIFCEDVTLGALESRTIQLTAVPKKEVQLLQPCSTAPDDVCRSDNWIQLAGFVEDPERDLGHF